MFLGLGAGDSSFVSLASNSKTKMLIVFFTRISQELDNLTVTEA